MIDPIAQIQGRWQSVEADKPPLRRKQKQTPDDPESDRRSGSEDPPDEEQESQVSGRIDLRV